MPQHRLVQRDAVYSDGFHVGFCPCAGGEDRQRPRGGGEGEGDVREEWARCDKKGGLGMWTESFEKGRTYDPITYVPDTGFTG